MKNSTKYIVLALLMSATLSLSARDFVQGDRIYVQPIQSDAIGDWGKDGANLFLYLFGGSSGTSWLKLNLSVGGVYAATFTANCNYNKVIVVRKSNTDTNANWNNVWNQTCDLTIPDGKELNCINQFWMKDGDCPADPYSDWKVYAPRTDLISAYINEGITAEEVHICSSALGDPYSLKVKLNTNKTAYLHDDVYAHAWYSSTDGNNWTSVDGFADKYRSQEYNKDTLLYLPTTLPSGVLYYYLFANNPKGRRLIKITTDGENCNLDCSITSFETAISAVNADDNTFTLDGMVAFGEPNGNLMIECEGRSVTIPTPASPCSFSLTGVPAATTDGVTYTATAHFTGNASCTSSITFQVPNAKDAVDVITRETLTGQTITLEPQDADPNNDYVWIVNGVEYTKESGHAQTFTVDPFSTDAEQTYTYKEFYPISGTMEDMMSNGSYENGSGYGSYGSTSTISDYNFWGYFDQTASAQINFYGNSTLNPDGLADNGFAVVRNAHNFAQSFATVKARKENNFALFDAKSGTAGGNKRAWYATTANNPNLKLKKGTTYVLSFWAANINNYGEMDNAARFEFRIEYNGHTWKSRVLNLDSAEFRNNIWHQCSQTFYADEDCNNVTISVVNLNTNTLNIGNDFALDDIQFHAISSVSRVVKSQQQFVVKAHEPKVDAFTATVQPVACDRTDYTIAMHVEYQNPSGQLIIKDVTTGTEYPYDLPAVEFDTPATLNKNIVITTNEALHEWEAYFSEWTTAKKTATTVIPGFPAIEAKNFQFSEPGCTDLYTTLTFDLNYTYQQGTLTYRVDDLTAQTATYTVTDKSKKTKQLTFAGIPADGKSNHVLHVSFDGANSCTKDYNLPAVPFSPVINSVTVSGVPATVLCSAEDYSVTVEIVTPYDATGRTITLSYDDNGVKDTTVAATGTKTTAVLPLHTIGGAAQTITAAYTASSACTVTSDAFTPPTRVSCAKDEITICEGKTTTWKGNVYPQAPYIGTDTFTSGFDSLILTINAVPRITVGTVEMTCDEANEVRVPFTVTGGNPDTYDIAIDGNHYAGTVDGTDIVFTLTTMTPGDYAATVTVSETSGECESTENVRFTIAISKQMYSKWTDVLFIDNHEHLYAAYQWYADGAILSGETQQRLYVPAGMSGTSTLYYCRLTTTDGQTLYTCPQVFDDVPRSADNTPSTPAPERILNTYIIGPHVRIIRVQTGEEIETRKIFVNE